MAKLPDNCSDDKLLIVRGHNRWVVARTDRDGVDQADAETTGAAFARTVLGPASPAGTRSVFEFLSFDDVSGGQRYVIGAARPLIIRAQQAESAEQLLQLTRPGSGERVIAAEISCPEKRSLRGQVPWILSIDFDWRAPDTRVPWPSRKLTDAGRVLKGEKQALDFMAMAAYFSGAAREKDTDVIDELAKASKRAAAKVRDALEQSSPVLGTVLVVTGVVAAAYLVWRFAPRKRLAA